MRKVETARGVPKERGKLVTRMNIGPRLSGACSFAASEAEVDDAGYSPPTPKPTIPLATVIIQNILRSRLVQNVCDNDNFSSLPIDRYSMSSRCEDLEEESVRGSRFLNRMYMLLEYTYTTNNDHHRS